MAVKKVKKLKPYTPKDLDKAVRKLLDTLAKSNPRESNLNNHVVAAASFLHSLGRVSGGMVIAGCCTQGCCDLATLRILKRIQKGKKSR